MPVADEEDTPEATPGARLGDVFGLAIWPHLRDRFELATYEIVCVDTNIVPLFAERIFEEQGNHRVRFDERGRTLLERIDDPMMSMPEMLDFPVKSREERRAYASRYNPADAARFPEDWEDRVTNWAARDNPLRLGEYPAPWSLFGAIRELMGFTRLLYMFYDDPALVDEMMEFFTEYCLAFCKRILPKVAVDHVWLWEDMAYKTASMISPEHFRRFMLPRYRRLTDYMRSQGVDVIMVDSDGNVDELIPLWIEAGINAIEPLEVQCGSDPVALRREYGSDLLMIGGIDKRALAKDRTAIDQALANVPWLLGQGGYVPMLDHDVPPDVSWDNFVYYREQLARICEGR